MTTKQISTLALGLFLAFHAHAKTGPLVSFTIEGDSSRVPEFQHRGQSFVAGNPGDRYSISLRNNTPERVLVVLSVDGVNAVTGQTAGSSQRGYVLRPYETTEVSGWRKSLQGVARFYFTDLSGSYAARTGRADNVGIIGIAVFREQPRRYQERDIVMAQGAAASAKADRAAEAASPTMGTGHGEWQQNYASTTTFERRSTRPEQVSTLRYDSFRNLERRGILPRNWRLNSQRQRGPEAFPGEFVPDPRY